MFACTREAAKAAQSDFRGTRIVVMEAFKPPPTFALLFADEVR
jgi:hypothetical protein